MAKDENNILICAAIPYLTGDPHIGTAMDGIYADTLRRYYKQQGGQVAFTLGTDEYGDKNYRKASSSGLELQSFFADEAKKFTDMYQVLNVEYTHFTRTSASSQHKKGVISAWKKLEPFIYKGSYKGKYDIKEEQFITIEEARQIAVSDPERYQRLEDIEEENYFFKLSAFNEILLEKINSNQLEIIPKRARNETIGLLKQGLKDISLTRPKSKVSWGIEVPNDPSQVMYVWIDALMNYLTTLGYPGEEAMDFWPADVQVVGKDIVRFHATIWPAMLIALEMPLPKKLYAHGFISLDGKPMSKSQNNILMPQDVVDRFGSDVLRYYVTRHIPSHGDGDFSWQKLINAYNGELANDLGNLVSRTAKMVNNYQGGSIGQIPEDEHDTNEYEKLIEQMHFDKAMDFVFDKIKGLNQYIETEKPWQMAKSGDAVHLQRVLGHIVGNLIQIGKLIEPFMPQTGQVIINIFSTGIINYDGNPLFPRVELKMPEPSDDN